jgi:leucyl-tRNA synthetase
MLWFGLGIVFSVQLSGTQLIDNVTIFPLELNTMPGWAEVLGIGCVIWMRTIAANLPAKTPEILGKRGLIHYGSRTQHLLYSSFLEQIPKKDKGFAPTEEPFKTN